MRYTWAARLTWLVLAIFASVPAGAGSFPEKSVMLITSTAAGGGPDVIARLVADGFSQAWKQQVLVNNRPGGRGIIATQAVTSAEPDGYTLYVALGSTFVVLPVIQPKLPFDLQHDIVPIGLVGEQPFIIAVSPKLGVKTLAELIARSKREPSRILYGTVRGSAPHLAMELMQSRSNAKMMLVPYPAITKAASDALGGTISVVVDSLSALGGLVKSGQLNAIAVTSAKRLPDFPDLPAVAETLPGFEATGWFPLMGPAGIPDAIRSKVNADLRAVLDRPDVRQKFAELGTYARPMSPAATAEFIQRQRETWIPVVKQINLMSH